MKSKKIDTQLLIGVVAGGAGAKFVGNLANRIPAVAANPTIGAGAKIAAGVVILMYGGKNKMVQGAGMGIAAVGGQELLANVGFGGRVGRLSSDRLGVRPLARLHRKDAVLGHGSVRQPAARPVTAQVV